MIKVGGLQHTHPQRPGERITHRTSLYQFPWRANPVQVREGVEGSRRSLSLSSLCASCLESGTWAPGRLFSPQRGARGPESRRGSIPAHLWSRPSLLGEAALQSPWTAPGWRWGKQRVDNPRPRGQPGRSSS